MVEDTTRHEQGTLEDDDVDGEDDSEDEVQHDSKKRKRGNQNPKDKQKPRPTLQSPVSTADRSANAHPVNRDGEFSFSLISNTGNRQGSSSKH
jgi:hypothetical protein